MGKAFPYRNLSLTIALDLAQSIGLKGSNRFSLMLEVAEVLASLLTPVLLLLSLIASAATLLTHATWKDVVIIMVLVI